MKLHPSWSSPSSPTESTWGMLQSSETNYNPCHVQVCQTYNPINALARDYTNYTINLETNCLVTSDSNYFNLWVLNKFINPVYKYNVLRLFAVSSSQTKNTTTSVNIPTPIGWFPIPHPSKIIQNHLGVPVDPMNINFDTPVAQCEGRT